MRGERVHEHWSSRSGFLLAAVGSAIGLANIWRFPYITGMNGGGAFVLIYIASIAIFIAPLLIAEIMIGRRAGQSPINALSTVALENGRSANWRWLGGLGVSIALLGLSFYSVVAGWTFAFVIEALKGAFAGFDAAAAKAASDGISGDPVSSALWHGLFMGLTIWIVARGIKGGLEKAVKGMMPLLFGLVVLLVIHGAVAGDFGRALAFMFKPDFSQVTKSTFLTAVGQAFFTLGIGVGSMMTYGAYLGKKVSIPRSVAVIASADTLVAILAGLAIFPIMFAAGLAPEKGPKLIFETLPIAFGQMPGGAFIGALFFILLAIAALTSAISLLEPAVSWLEETKGWSRRRMAVVTGVAVWVVGLASVFSFNIWADFRPIPFVGVLADKTIFGVLEYLVANVLIPVGGILIAVFAGWLIKREAALDELGLVDGIFFRTWRFLLRFVTPTIVAAVLYFGL
ncbi:MAG: sodium-dependent transporter [Sphingomonadales bacterium]